MAFAKVSARHYLAGMIDGEGTVTDPQRIRRQSRAVRITNTDRELITACEECCVLLGLRFKVYERSPQRCKGKRTYDLVMYGRDNFEKLARLPLRSPIKLARLKGLVLSYPRPKRPTRYVLLKLHAVESVAYIAAQYGVTRVTVYRWLRENAPK